MKPKKIYQDPCHMTQVTIKTMIEVYGRRELNKKENHEIRDKMMEVITDILLLGGDPNIWNKEITYEESNQREN